MKHITRLPSILLLAVSILMLCSTFVQAQSEKVLEDRWYVMLIEGKPSGWAHEVLVTSADGKQFISRSDSKMSIKRGPITMVIEQASEFVETADGKPVKATTSATTGKTKVVQEITFTTTHMQIITTQGKQKTQSEVELPKEKWLTPAAAGRYITEQLKENAKTISVTTLEPAADLKPLRIEMKVQGSEDLEVMGRVVPATAVETTFSNLPGITSKQYVDSSGRMLKMSLTPMPGFSITTVLADKDLAMAQVDPPEVLAATLIEMKTPIKDARNLKSAVYELTFKATAQDKDNKPLQPPPLPKTGHQTVVWGDDQTARVIVDMANPVTPGDDLPKKEHRQANAVLNSDDPKIKELVAAALKGKDEKISDYDKAEVLRAYVHRYIRKKDLSVGFAYASEVARTRQGDCTEHGVLLAAMMRAAGLPSRTVSGLIYVDEFTGKKNIFGYHMWAQAWITDEKTGGHWIDFDGTLDQPGFDAAHITLGVSAMSDGTMNNDMMHLIPVIGRLDIKVIESKTK